MDVLLLKIKNIVELGLLFFPLVISLYISSRILHFDDLSIEGSFGLGGALTALLLTHQYSGYSALIISIIGGMCVGAATSFLHCRLRVKALMSGLIVTTGLFSIILKLAGAALHCGTKNTIFNWSPFHKYTILIIIIGTLFYSMRWFLQTQIGFLLKAVGDNPSLLITLEKNPHHFITLGLILSNGLTALCGSLFIQYTGFFSLWSQVGILIIGMVSLMLGEAFSHRFSIPLIFGPILYQGILALTFACNFDQSWNKLFTAVLIIGILILQRHYKRVNYA